MKSENGFSNTPLWEKLVGLAGLVLVCFTIGFLLWSAISAQDDPPNVSFEIHEIHAIDGRYLVLLDVHNSGDLTAADLQVEVSLSDGQGNTESATGSIDYLAAGSTRRMGFYFGTDPGLGELQFRALGYHKP